MAGNELSAPVAALAAELIKRRSVTPDDAGCQDLLAERLQRAGMTVERLRFGDVDNLFATHGDGAPHLLLLGHTDVVPPGPLSEWSSDPFRPTVRDGMLYGRGAADMKSSLAAFVVALEGFLADCPEHVGRLSLLLTSDEEGVAEHGVRRVAPWLAERGLAPDRVLVGEPSSASALGDVVRIGRRGSIQARLVVDGVQGHTAYADPADNPVHRAAAALAELVALDFDDGDEAFPATRLQVSNVAAGTGADNVTPGRFEVLFNLRYNPNASADGLERRVRDVLAAHGLDDATLSWRISGAPFGPADGPLFRAVRAAVLEATGRPPAADTGGGTSDGRFFGPDGIETVELGPVNRTIHRVDEAIALADLERLPTLYRGVMRRLLA